MEGKREREEQPVTSGEKAVAGGDEVKKPRTHRKRRICVLYGYSGKGYHGSMKGGNDEFPTLEGEMEKALIKAGYVRESFKSISMSRASRTDKGVSALINAFGAQLYISEEECANRRIWIDRVNSFLPPAIRVWEALRVRGSFSAREAPCSRTYDYVAPAFCLRPKAVPADEWHLDDSTLAALNSVLLYFVGTHNYHNYTNGKNFKSKDAKRVILSFKALSKTYIGGEEFVHFRIKGQSFMLHQIRKIMCMVFQVAREGFVADGSARKVIGGTFGPPHINIMKAPAQGLFLKEIHFDVYNQHWGHGDAREPVALSTDMVPVVDAFAQQHIWPQIALEKAEFEKFLVDMEDFPIDFADLVKTCDEEDERKRIRAEEREQKLHAMNTVTKFD